MAAPAIVLDPSEVAGTRTQVTISNWVASEVDWGDAVVDPYMSEASRGSVPVDFRTPNRVISIPLRLRTIGATSFDTIRSQIQAKVGLFQRDGGWVKRTSTLGDVFADVMTATLRLGGVGFHEGRSMDVDAVLTLECSPDWYGAEIDLGTTSETTLPEVRNVMTGVKGNYPCRVRIVVNENDADSQLGLIWGIRSKNYSSAATAALAYEAEALTPLDTAAITALTGASGAGSNTMRHNNLSTSWTPVLSTQILSGSAHMTHQGSYRVWARAYTTSATPPRVRFLWDVGDFVSPEENTAVTIPGTSNFFPVDLGAIRLDATTGTHRWQGVIQAKGAVGGENVYIDRLWLVPTDDGYGVLRAPISIEPGLATYVARDEFNQTAGALIGKTLPAGGTWAGSGDTDDFSVTGGGEITRAAVSDTGEHFGLAGTGTATNIVAQADFKMGTPGSGVTGGVFVRYVDTSNWIAFRHVLGSVSETVHPVVYLSIAGVVTTFEDDPLRNLSPGLGTYWTLKFYVDVSGRFLAWAYPPGAYAGTPLITGTHSALATGGALATGRYGVVDKNGTATASTRTYDNFAAWVPTPDAVMFASQSAELSSTGMLREDSTGTAWGPVSHVIGSLPRLPPSGLEAHSVELFVKGSRGDFDQIPDTGIDDISVQVPYRPSWLHIPEA